MIINVFKDKIFPLYHQSRFEDEEEIRDENGLINYQKLERLIFLKGKNINDELVRKHFLAQNLRSFLK